MNDMNFNTEIVSGRKFLGVMLVLAIFYQGCNSKSFIELEVDRMVQKKVPLFVEKENPAIIEISFSVPEEAGPLELEKAELFFTEESDPEILESITVNYSENEGPSVLFGDTEKMISPVKIKGARVLSLGQHTLSFGFRLKKGAPLEKSFRFKKIELVFSGNRRCTIQSDSTFVYRPLLVLRAAGQDNCDTYRIPGLVTTNRGTLIAVYDNRYNNSKDLQEDIDIGMSRSTDGGQTWEPMKVIMDMDEYGGRPQQMNGIGDPCVLYDHTTNTIWVAALWMSGATEKDMLWWASGPGLKPEETGQFILVKSTDDGLTWSGQVNITEQIKDPAWQLLLQGPGRGITLKDGTLVFPAQFKADIGEKAIDGGRYTCHSTIVFSKDHGKTWEIGIGVKSNTSEAQVVQLADGRLMLNMRDDRNRIDKGETNGRAVAVTNDLGRTWTIHPSSNSALPEPNCMANLIAADIEINGETKQVLFFSNPNNKETRTNMTIKASLDEGLTWPEKYQAELNPAAGFGYSCLTMVDKETIGILYEGIKELYFQKIPVSNLLSFSGKSNKSREHITAR
jgi:sialidase-1